MMRNCGVRCTKRTSYMRMEILSQHFSETRTDFLAILRGLAQSSDQDAVITLLRGRMQGA
jgi:hypothetical protein